jgi:nucleoside-diphosphate-sugar epimerase
MTRVLVTGAHGKVGRVAARALADAGHEVVMTDMDGADAERDGDLTYVQADVQDAGEAFAVVRDIEAVVHAAAIPTPERNPPQVVFQNNVMGVFNMAEAAVREGVSRFVNISSITVFGLPYAERPFTPDYLPVDEGHPDRPQDPYALAKQCGELLMDGVVRRSDMRAVSLRPALVVAEDEYATLLRDSAADPAAGAKELWCYVDIRDLADVIRLAVECDLAGHERFYITAADNAVGSPLEDLAREHLGAEVAVRREALGRADASGVSPARAQELLGYTPARSWRDFV